MQGSARRVCTAGGRPPASEPDSIEPGTDSGGTEPPGPAATGVRGWWNTVEIILFGISNSMKPHPSVFHAYASKLRHVIVVFEPTILDEVSNRGPPTSHGDASASRTLQEGYQVPSPRVFAPGAAWPQRKVPRSQGVAARAATRRGRGTSGPRAVDRIGSRAGSGERARHREPRNLAQVWHARHPPQLAPHTAKPGS